MKQIYLLGFFLITVFTATAQKRIDFEVPKITSGVDLRAKFKQHKLVKADLEGIYAKLENDPNGQIELSFSGQHRWTFELHENNLLSSNYFVTVAGSNGISKRSNTTVKTFDGTISGGRGKISLTVDHGFFSAVVNDGGQTWYIEQAQYINGESDNEVLVMYNAQDVIEEKTFRCGVEDDKNRADELLQPNSGMRTLVDGCKLVELAIASDASMFTKFGSTSAVFNHNIAVMNNVAVLYRYEFIDNIEFIIVTQYGSMDYSNDPLSPNTTSTNPSTLLPAFANWGQQAPNFGVTFDVGQFWTNRDFDENTVGLAYLGSICTSSKYHILQDYSLNLAILAGMTAHEIGHNFNAGHDASGSPTIMAPTVSTSDIWSGDSQTAISSYVSSRACVSSCNGTVTPAFIAMPSAVCVGATVQFKDNTANGSIRSWTFQSGNPATSTSARQAITYLTPGAFDVTLVSGAKSLVSDNYIIVNNPALNTTSCPLPSGTPGRVGLRYFALNSISSSSGYAPSDGGKYVDRSCTLITELRESTSYDITASIGYYDGDETTAIFERIKVYIDYDSDGLFNEATELVVNSTSFWAGYIAYDATNRPWLRFTTPANATKDKILRVRVVTDTSNPTNACHNPVAGQVEDFGVVFRSSSPLPVDLISFSGRKTGNGNLLEWKTVNETQMQSYTVERSETGIGFSDIGTVSSNNTGKNRFTYQLTDEAIPSTVGGYYYKLRMAEMDGKTTFSRIIFVKNTDVQSGLVLQNCQTLIGDDIAYELVSDSERTVNVSLFNILGTRVKTWEKHLSKGSNQIKDDMTNLNSGLLFLSIQSNDQPVIVQKILK